ADAGEAGLEVGLQAARVGGGGRACAGASGGGRADRHDGQRLAGCDLPRRIGQRLPKLGEFRRRRARRRRGLRGSGQGGNGQKKRRQGGAYGQADGVNSGAFAALRLRWAVSTISSARSLPMQSWTRSAR